MVAACRFWSDVTLLFERSRVRSAGASSSEASTASKLLCVQVSEVRHGHTGDWPPPVRQFQGC